MRVSVRLALAAPESNGPDGFPASLLPRDGFFPGGVETFAGWIWILQRARGFFQHGRERGDGLAVEVGAGSGFVDIDVGNAFGAQFVGELLSPFRGTGEADFFAVPTADDDGAARAHALFRELAEGAGEFHHGRGAARGIDTAEHPGIAVIAEDDPFVGQLRAANAAFDHVVGLDAVVHLDFQMDLHALAAEVILNGQSALPVLRGDGAGPSMFSSRGLASCQESGRAMIFGAEAASSIGMRFAPGTEAQPGVCGSPGTMKS